MKNCVIAMGYGGIPLIRKAVGSGERVIYLSNLDQNIARDGEPVGVGFPREFVYEFDEELFDKLQSAFRDTNREELDALWKAAKRWDENATL